MLNINSFKMIELILKNDLERNKIDALLNFLKSWNIDVEIKVSTEIESKKGNRFYTLCRYLER